MHGRGGQHRHGQQLLHQVQHWQQAQHPSQQGDSEHLQEKQQQPSKQPSEEQPSRHILEGPAGFDAAEKSLARLSLYSSCLFISLSLPLFPELCLYHALHGLNHSFI